jgi:hypothetical protein
MVLMMADVLKSGSSPGAPGLKVLCGDGPDRAKVGITPIHIP